MGRINKVIDIKDAVKKVVDCLSEKFYSKDIPYATQFKLDEGVVNVYNTGKLVYQGSELGWEQFHKILDDCYSKAGIDVVPHDIKFPFIGCDEAGKGEFLGPLVVSCVWVKDKMLYKELWKQGVRDSKDLTKSSLWKLYSFIDNLKKERDCISVSHVVLHPGEFDHAYNVMKNIARILDFMYMDAILRLPLSKMIVVDRFSPRALLNNFIPSVMLVERAEKYVPVAAASIVAKTLYEKWIEENVPEDVAEVLRRSDLSIDRKKNIIGDKDISRWVKNAFKSTK